VRSLSLSGLGDTVLIEFEIVLAPVLADGTFVYNQAELSAGGLALAVSTIRTSTHRRIPTCRTTMIQRRS